MLPITTEYGWPAFKYARSRLVDVTRTPPFSLSTKETYPSVQQVRLLARMSRSGCTLALAVTLILLGGRGQAASTAPGKTVSPDRRTPLHRLSGLTPRGQLAGSRGLLQVTAEVSAATSSGPCPPFFRALCQLGLQESCHNFKTGCFATGAQLVGKKCCCCPALGTSSQGSAEEVASDSSFAHDANDVVVSDQQSQQA